MGKDKQVKDNKDKKEKNLVIQPLPPYRPLPRFRSGCPNC